MQSKWRQNRSGEGTTVTVTVTPSNVVSRQYAVLEGLPQALRKSDMVS